MLNLNLSKEELNEIIFSLELDIHRSTLCKDLSKGTIQKIIISPLYGNYKWDYLFMDEPFEHLDMQTCESLKQKIDDFKGFLFIINHKEHILDDIKNIEMVIL